MRGDKYFTQKKTYKYRWVLMFFAVWVLLGAYFCYDTPASLHNTLKDHMENVDPDAFEIYFSGLYSAYAFANIFLPFITGAMRDVIGDRFVMVLLGVLLVVGQSVFTFGVQQKSFMIMYCGRILVGWGIESMMPTLTSFFSPYYKEDYFAFSVGMNQFFAHVGLVLCMIYSPRVAISSGIIVAISIGIFLNIFTFFCGAIAILLDQHAEKHVQNYEGLLPDQGNKECRSVIEVEYQEEQKEQEVNQPNGEEVLNQPQLQVNRECPVENNQQKQGFFQTAFDFSVIRTFPRLFWYMAVFYGIIYCSVLALVNVSIGYFTETWLPNVENPEIIASSMVAMMWLLTGALTPLFGIMIDYLGHRSAISILTALICMMAHLLVLANQPFVGLILLGIALALAFATVWTGIVYVIDHNYYGKAYGVVVAIYNGGFTMVPLLVGVFRAYTKTYFISQIFLAVLGLIALIIAVFLYIEDHKTGFRIDQGLLVGRHSEFDYSSVLHPDQNKRQNQSNVKEDRKEKEKAQ